MHEPTRIPAPGRRVVTGVNTSGKSVVVSDGPVPKDATWSESGTGSGGDLWIVSRDPVDLSDKSDPLVGYTLQSWPSPGGVIARMNTLEPGFMYPMHRSDTIDFVFIISGQLELILEEGSTVLRSGETVVQCGTNHAWRVVGNEPCTFAAVLIDASPQTPKADAATS
ncbi:MAG: cupin domain-containing protein [Desulfobacteraceae bacterium]|nr:cupin domain-containing protein [Desulfobacteraceae bacterium]